MILVDNNISHRVAVQLHKFFEGSKHVVDFNMDENTKDATIWKFSKEKGYTILTKDTDFEAMSRLYGCPPKVIQLTCGNKTTAQLMTILEKSSSVIGAFIGDTENCLMYLQ